MDIDISGVKLSYDGRKSSLMISTVLENCDTLDSFYNKVERHMKSFGSKALKMKPAHIALVGWNAGYEFGHPSTYAGVVALGCETIKPWKHIQCDHLIERKNPFDKLAFVEFGGSISFDYENKKIVYRTGMPELDWILVNESERFIKKGFEEELLDFDSDTNLGAMLQDAQEDDLMDCDW